MPFITKDSEVEQVPYGVKKTKGKIKDYKVIIPAVLAFLVILTAGFFILREQIIKFPISYLNQASASLNKEEAINKRSSDVRINSKTPEGRYQSQEIISLTPQQEPSIKVSYYKNYRYQDINNLKIDIYQIAKSDLLNFLIYTKENDNGDVSKTLDVSALKKITSLNFDHYNLDENILLPLSESGLWLIRANVNNSEFNDVIIIRSNTGVVIKEENDQYLFWAQNITNGKRLTKGLVETYNLQGEAKLLNSKYLNNVGIATLPIKEEANIALVDNSFGEIAFIPLNFSSSWYYPYTPFTNKDIKTKYYLFTDRPLYRPGDRLNFKSIAREDDDGVYSIPSGYARVRIFYGYDREEPLFEKIYPITLEGVVTGEYIIPETARTGRYQIEISHPDKESSREYWLRATVDFNVENYRKPEYVLDSYAKNSEIIRGDKAEFHIDGAYLFGQPLVGETVEVQLRVSHFYNYRYDVDENFLEDKFRYGYWYGSQIASQKLTLDNNGQAVYLYDTANLQKSSREQVDSYTQVLTLEASFNDESGNRVVTTANVLVRDGEYSIFRKDRLYSLPVGRSENISIFLKSHTDVPISNVELSGTVRLTYWENRGANNYDKIEDNINTFKLITDKNGMAVIPFNPEKGGLYKFLVEGKDQRGNVIKRSFSIWAYSNTEYTLGSDSRVGSYNLNIRADKEMYASSELAKLTISSDYADRDVLLTIERGRVRRYFVIPLVGFNTQFSLAFLPSDLPNVFASVAAFAPTGFTNASERLDLIAESKKIKIDLSYDKSTYAPGETVRLTVKTTDHENRSLSADVAVWTVDKALYQLLSDRRKSIFDFFWGYHHLNETNIAHSLQGIRSDSMAEMGGCFVKGTQVLIPGGSKSIDEIKVGDKILTKKGAENDELVEATVTKTFVHNVDGYLIINGQLRVTPEHLLWVSGSWKEAGDIQVGDTLLDYSGRSVVIESVEWQKGRFEVYNLTVKDYQTYFAEGVWVHNAKGGSDGDGAREVFKDVAYWNPHVRTGNNGIATISFKLPDNLTTWVVNAVGVTYDTKVGENLEEFIVTKPVIIRPILPNYLRTGDSIEFSSLIYNYTPQDSEFSFTCSLSDKSAEANLTIDRGNFSQFVFPAFVFDEVNDKTMFSCKAESLATNDGDEVKLPFSIRKFGFIESRTMVGRGNTEYKFALQPDSDRELSSVTVSLTPSIFGTLPHAMKYLIQYPYGCVEQTTSRFVPVVIAKENEKLFAEFLKDKDLDAMINEGIKRLIDLKGYKGGWGWWHDNEVNSFITAYVTEYLLRAQKLGYSVPESVFSDVRTRAEQRIEENISKEERVAVLYTLTLFGSKKGKTQITDFEGLTADIHALAILANIANGNFDTKTNGAQSLLEKGEKSGEIISWSAGGNDFFGSKDASNALALRALVAARELGTAEKIAQYFSQNRSERYWSNTFATAQVLNALTAFAKAVSLDTKSVPYRVLLNDKEIAKGTINDPLATVDVALDQKELSQELTIVVKLDNDGPLYSTVLIDEYRTDKNLKAANNGLEVFREYKGDFVPGGTVEVFITVSGLPQDRSYLVIEDHLPAGLIPVNTRLESEREMDKQRYDYYYQSGLDIKDDGVIFGYRWWRGETITAHYKARVVSRGEFAAPPAIASFMYSPQISGRSAIHTIRVSDKDANVGLVKLSDTEQQRPPDAQIPPTESEIPLKQLNKTIYLLILSGVAVLVLFFALYKKFKKSSKKDATTNGQ